MADAAVTFILDNLKELIASTNRQISEVNDKVKPLSDDLELFKFFLQDANKKPIEDAAMKALVELIRNAVYEAENIVDEYVIEAAQYKSSSLFSKIKHPLDRPTKLLNLAQKIEPMKAMVKKIYDKKKFGNGARLDGEGSKPSKITKVVFGSFMPNCYKTPKRKHNLEPRVAPLVLSPPAPMTVATPISQAAPEINISPVPPSQFPVPNQQETDNDTTKKGYPYSTSKVTADWNGTEPISNQRPSPDINISVSVE